jgi:hypothetical protein
MRPTLSVGRIGHAACSGKCAALMLAALLSSPGPTPVHSGRRAGALCNLFKQEVAAFLSELRTSSRYVTVRENPSLGSAITAVLITVITQRPTSKPSQSPSIVSVNGQLLDSTSKRLLENLIDRLHISSLKDE